MSEGGLYMTINLLKKVIEEENEIMNMNQPERNLKIGQGYVVHFGERHNLFEKCRERKAFERENWCGHSRHILGILFDTLEFYERRVFKEKGDRKLF